MFSIQNCINTMIQFGYKVLIREFAPGKNVVFSSYAAHIIMSLLNNGAIGKTEREYSMTLVGQEASESLKQELNNFHKINFKKFEKDDVSNIATLSINNFLFYKKGEKMYEEFEKIAKDDYGCIVNQINFDFGYKEEINEFIKSKTNGKMINALSREISPTHIVLINTISFLGKWKSPFDKNLTTKKNFYLSKCDNVLVDMMQVTDKFYYYENEECEVVKMSYVGKKYFMLFILPKREVCIELLFKNISENNMLKKICTSLKKELLTVNLPKFKFETSTNLNKEFIVKCENSTDDSNGHELKKILKNRFDNINVLQRTYISVDEIQTEAKMITETMLSTDCFHNLPPSKKVNFKRNFLFYLMHNDDNKNSLPLISGIISNPRQFE